MYDVYVKSAELIDELRAAGWQVDPTGRHQVRYWDGAGWTVHVADNGITGTDPL